MPVDVTSPAAPPRVLVVVLAWNGRAYTEACVASYLAQAYPRFEVLVVDNASTDGTPAALRARFGDAIQLLQNDRNLFFAGGMNTGLRRALASGADYVLI